MDEFGDAESDLDRETCDGMDDARELLLKILWQRGLDHSVTVIQEALTTLLRAGETADATCRYETRSEYRLVWRQIEKTAGYTADAREREEASRSGTPSPKPKPYRRARVWETEVAWALIHALERIIAPVRNVDPEGQSEMPSLPAPLHFSRPNGDGTGLNGGAEVQLLVMVFSRLHSRSIDPDRALEWDAVSRRRSLVRGKAVKQPGTARWFYHLLDNRKRDFDTRGNGVRRRHRA